MATLVPGKLISYVSTAANLRVSSTQASPTRRAFSIQMMNGDWLLPVSDISAWDYKQMNHRASRATNMIRAALISFQPLEVIKKLSPSDTAATSSLETSYGERSSNGCCPSPWNYLLFCMEARGPGKNQLISLFHWRYHNQWIWSKRQRK